jgi:hypothetical protein
VRRPGAGRPDLRAADCRGGSVPGARGARVREPAAARRQRVGSPSPAGATGRPSPDPLVPSNQ